MPRWPSRYLYFWWIESLKELKDLLLEVKHLITTTILLLMVAFRYYIKVAEVSYNFTEDNYFFRIDYHFFAAASNLSKLTSVTSVRYTTNHLLHSSLLKCRQALESKSKEPNTVFFRMKALRVNSSCGSLAL